MLFTIIAGASALEEPPAKELRKKRRWSVRPIFCERDKKGHFHNLFQTIKTDPELIFYYIRMTHVDFQKLCDFIRHRVVKKSNWPALCSEHRLALTL